MAAQETPFGEPSLTLYSALHFYFFLMTDAYWIDKESFKDKL